MESYTERSEKLEKEAENIDHTKEAVPYSSCYESLIEEERLKWEAKELQETARTIREKFKAIVDDGFGVPNGSLLRKAIITIQKGKLSFSIDQLLKACVVLFDEVPYIVFKSPKETRPYITVLFWASNPREEKCSVLNHLEAVKQEVAVDRVEVRIDVDVVFSPSRYVLYLMDNSSGTVVRNRQFKLGTEEEKQLTAIMSILCNPRSNLNPTRLPMKRPNPQQIETAEKKLKDC